MGRIVALLAAVFVASQGALAAEGTYPKIEASIPVEIQNDWNYRSQDPVNEHNQLYTTTEPEITVHLTKELSIFAHGVIEPMHDPDPGEDRAFDDHGIFLHDLYVKYETDRFSVMAGKFTPNFGIAWDAAPGIYGTDVAGDTYEFSERIGFGASVTLDTDSGGKHTVSASTFFLDTSILYESAGRGRDPQTLSESDGGVSNTGEFSSFAVALDGNDIKALKGFRYHIAYIHQAGGMDSTDDERGYAIGAEYVRGLGGEFKVVPMAEYAAFDGADGVKGQERDLLTLAAQLKWRNWNTAVSWTGRNTKAPDGVRTGDTHLQLSAGYAFDSGLSVDVGWLVNETDGVETRTIGLLLAYTIKL